MDLGVQGSREVKGKRARPPQEDMHLELWSETGKAQGHLPLSPCPC